MSMMRELITMIAKADEELEAEGSDLTIDTIYDRMSLSHGDALFRSERHLAKTAIRGKIHAYLRRSRRVDAETDGQGTLFKEEKRSLLPVRQDDGSYVYVPEHKAKSADIRAVMMAKRANIRHAQRAYKKWRDGLSGVLPIMDELNITQGEALKIIAEREAAKGSASDSKADKAA